jgi:uncharacterized membrane protein YqiK
MKAAYIWHIYRRNHGTIVVLMVGVAMVAVVIVIIVAIFAEIIVVCERVYVCMIAGSGQAIDTDRSARLTSQIFHIFAQPCDVSRM